MALSNYNAWAEDVLACDLSASGLRLAWALQRLLLGYNCTQGPLGVKQLRDVSRLHGRSFERARAELVASGLIEVVPGSGGRGHATRYTLNLRVDADVLVPANLRATADVSRGETSAETSAPERTFNGHKPPQKPPRYSGGSRGQGLNLRGFRAGGTCMKCGNPAVHEDAVLCEAHAVARTAA